MKQLNDATVAIVGLGLMGGSLALALQKRHACRQILAITPEKKVCDQALRIGAVDQASTDLRLAENADLIVLATPVRVILEQLPMVDKVAKDGAVILDLGSTKEQIAAEMQKLGSRIQPIGGHPMCGKEQSGLHAAEGDLFQGAAFALTPLDRTRPETLAWVQDFVRAIGARPVVLDPAQHDRIVSAVSHLPFLLAVCLMETASELEQHEDRVFELAASGFRDGSRLAASDTQMMLDILATNGVNIAQQVRVLAQKLNDLVPLVERGDLDNLKTVLSAAAIKRRGLLTRSNG